MKKWLPWILPAVFAAWIIGGLRIAPEKSPYQIQDFGRFPVLLNGRVQPLDTVARNALLVMRSKQTVLLDEGSWTPLRFPKSMSASQWLLEVLTRPEKADDVKLFRIDNPELLDMLHLPHDRAEFRKYFSLHELLPHLSELETQGRRLKQAEAQTMTPLEKQTVKLYEAVIIYNRLRNSLQPAMQDGQFVAMVHPQDPNDFAEELSLFQKALPAGVEAAHKFEKKEAYDEKDLKTLQMFFERYGMLAEWSYPLMVPPAHPEQNRDGWTSVGTNLLQSLGNHEIHPAVNFYAQMSSAYRHENPQAFNQAVDGYRQWLGSHGLTKEVGKAKAEFFFNAYEPFYKSINIYVFAFILACLSWFNSSKWLNRSAFRLLLLALAVHTSGLIFRMVLQGRPPVTNLYSSAIFVGWGAVVLGIILERIYRDGIGAVTAGTVGFITLIIAHNLSMDGDTMEMLRAVLDTNFWLATHVVVITLGYASVFVSGFLGIIYIMRGVFTKTLTASTAKALTRMVYGIVCFSTLFSFVGTVLGGIWADQSWGRFWGWDPKENGALIIVLWCAIVLHARWGGLIRERGLINCAIFGNIVTSFSWFGVNMLGVGLHAYGFMDQAFKWLIAFVVSQLVIIGLGLLPLHYWKSFKVLKPAPAMGGRKAATANSAKPVPAT